MNSPSLPRLALFISYNPSSSSRSASVPQRCECHRISCSCSTPSACGVTSAPRRTHYGACSSVAIFIYNSYNKYLFQRQRCLNFTTVLYREQTQQTWPTVVSKYENKKTENPHRPHCGLPHAEQGPQ